MVAVHLVFCHSENINFSFGTLGRFPKLIIFVLLRLGVVVVPCNILGPFKWLLSCFRDCTIFVKVIK